VCGWHLINVDPRQNRHFMTTRILIADDSRTVRHSLHGLLERHLDWKVCADAVDGTDAIAKAQQFIPDVVVLDFFMPGMTGVEAARELKKSSSFSSRPIITLEITAQLVEQAKSVGIRGAVQKADTGEMIRGVEALLRKETFLMTRGRVS
jgi:DNA-binding NarL/FixJ family response regulator